METPADCASPQTMSTQTGVDLSSARGLGHVLSTPSKAISETRPTPPVHVATLGDSPTVGLLPNTSPVKADSAPTPQPPPSSVNWAGDPASFVQPPAPNPTPAVVAASPSTPPASLPTEPVPEPCPANADMRPAPAPVAVPKVMPASVPEVAVSALTAPNVPLQDVRPAENAVVAVTATTSMPPASQLPAPAECLPKPAVEPTPTYQQQQQQQQSSSAMSSVIQTPSTSTVQSSVTTPRSLPPDRLVPESGATSSSYGYGQAKTLQGSYLRSHQQRRAHHHHRDSVGSSTCGTPSTMCSGAVCPAYHHDRKSRSVSPSFQTDSCRSSISSTMPTSTAQVSAGRSPAPLQAPSPVDWPQSASLYRMTTYSPRHATEYRNCVAPEPDDIRPSLRLREDTHVKVFGADGPDSPRTAAAAYAVASGGLQVNPGRRHAEDTQATLFGPPDPHRKSSRQHPDTHKSLFGPPTSTQPRSRSAIHDTTELLHHDPTADGRNGESLEAVRGRYALRHQDTGTKLFGDAPPATTPSTPQPKPSHQRDHDIFLTSRHQPESDNTSTTPQPHSADP